MFFNLISTPNFRLPPLPSKRFEHMHTFSFVASFKMKFSIILAWSLQLNEVQQLHKTFYAIDVKRLVSGDNVRSF